jgi:hypothetical protein
VERAPRGRLQAAVPPLRPCRRRTCQAVVRLVPLNNHVALSGLRKRWNFRSFAFSKRVNHASPYGAIVEGNEARTGHPSVPYGLHFHPFLIKLRCKLRCKEDDRLLMRSARRSCGGAAAARECPHTRAERGSAWRLLRRSERTRRAQAPSAAAPGGC